MIHDTLEIYNAREKNSLFDQFYCRLFLGEPELKFNAKTEQTHGKPVGQNIFDPPLSYL